MPAAEDRRSAGHDAPARRGADLVSDSGPSLSFTRTDSRARRFLNAAAAALVALSLPARAAELVPPDPWQVIHVAREFGPAEVASDGMGDPQIRGTTDGLHYRVTFYGCRLGRDCDTVLFDARFARNEWNEKRPPATLFAAWNGAKLFGRAWLDDEDRAVIDHPVALGPGIPRETLVATFERWRTALAEFAGHIGVR